IYTYTIPGLTQEQALQRAQTIYAELIAHEMKLTATLPGDNILGIDTMVQVMGTGTAWDQTYYPDSVTRRMSFDEGYSMNLHAKNH
ncbi:type IV secretion protein Rhs, partial [Salmonella enterica]